VNQIVWRTAAGRAMMVALGNRFGRAGPNARTLGGDDTNSYRPTTRKKLSMVMQAFEDMRAGS